MDMNPISRVLALVATAAAAPMMALVGVALLGVAVPGVVVAQTAVTQVPEPERVSRAVTRYSQVTPQIAAAGILQDGAVAELKSLGFTTVVDLRGPEEGTALEQRAAGGLGLRYINIPVTNEVPTDAQIVEFARVVESGANQPIIIHCASANRVGAMWALYRAARGAPMSTAIAEGRAIGLQAARENAVRWRLSRPPFAN